MYVQLIFFLIFKVLKFDGCCSAIITITGQQIKLRGLAKYKALLIFMHETEGRKKMKKRGRKKR